MPKIELHVAAVTQARIDELNAEYDGNALARAEPIFQVPLSHLKGSRRCSVCRLYYDDLPAWATISAMLVGGEKLADIAAVMETRGHHLTTSMLSSHRTKHLDATMWEIAAETAEFAAIAKQALGIPTGDLATMELKLSSAALLEALRKIDRKALIKLAKDEPVALIELANKHARALAAVQASDRQTQLNTAKLQLEKLKLDNQTAALLSRAMTALHKELSSSPEGEKLLTTIDQFVNSPKP